MPTNWALQDAKAKFSELTQRAITEGPQHVTLRGEPAVVVLSEREYQRLTGKKKLPTFADYFRNNPFKGVTLDLERDRDTGRTVEF